ncbi:MAG TPA: ATP-binding cassette domain-containing protein, partial [Actinomycetes bacterium]|nr:ATP-binding cassette domain-containing protein [Actinomycetes bacterium]
MSALVECQALDVAYGPVQVLFGVDFEVAEGEIVALLGTNGAGKSTLLKTAAGLLAPTAGRVLLDGHDITGADAEAVTRAGVSLMPGGKGIFPTVTVDEHLRLAAWTFRKDTARVAAARAEVLDLFPILAERHAQPAGYLSGGEQQMLALAQAFMTKPRLLLVDELSLGLAPAVVGQLLDVLRTVHAAGTTIVIVEQSVNVALTLAQRAVFMEKGEVRFTGPTAELLERPDLLRSVFIRQGPKAPAAATRPASPPPDDAPVLLSCRGIVKRFGGIHAVDEVDLDLRQGEI